MHDVERSISALDDKLRDALLLSTRYTFAKGAERLNITREQFVQRVDEAKRTVIRDLVGDWWDSEGMFVIGMHIDAAAIRMQRRRMGVWYRARKWLQGFAGETATWLTETTEKLSQGRQVLTPIGAVATIAVVVVAVAVYVVGREPTGDVRTPTESIPSPEVASAPPPSPASPEPRPEMLAFARGTAREPLENSDVRQLVGELSEDPRLAAWLLDTDEPGKEFVNIVIDIAAGTNPFQVEGALSLVASLDTEKTARLFESLSSQLEDAYKKEVGQQGNEFKSTLRDAAVHLLNQMDAPTIIQIAPYLPANEIAVSFYGDPSMPAGAQASPTQQQLIAVSLYSRAARLSMRRYQSLAQLQLIDMGPDNHWRVQCKIREIAEAIGLNNLPRPRKCPGQDARLDSPPTS